MGYIVCGVAKSQTRLKRLSIHSHTVGFASRRTELFQVMVSLCALSHPCICVICLSVCVCVLIYVKLVCSNTRWCPGASFPLLWGCL